MKKLFFKLDGNRYWIIILGDTDISGWYIIQRKTVGQEMVTEKFFLMRDLFKDSSLEMLHLALEPMQDSWIEVDIIANKNLVSIWSLESFKKQAKFEFKTDEEEYAFEDVYNKYYDKRWDEMPHIRLSIQDWENLQEKWLEIKKSNLNYVMFTLDDSGPLDKVDVYGKDELAQEDIACIEQEHEKYLKYEKARQKYIAHHPDYSDVWRGPQDDEYEADIMKYYDQD